MTPPMIRPMIISQWVIPSKVKKVAASVKVTKNSARLTDPIVSRGLSPRATKVDVTTGPQPPPPIASKKPPTPPSNVTLVFSFVSFLWNSLRSISKPIINRYMPTSGLIISVGRKVRVYAPTAPPMIPGIRSFLKRFFLTFLSLRCESPDVSVVNISDVCTLALADAGGMPSESKTDVDVTP